MHYPEAYLEGIRLFNAGHFWHAHEQWEICWRAVTDVDEDRFFKGIIQTAAALVKWQQGNQRGMHRNWAKSRIRLAGLPSPYMGVDLLMLHHEMETFIVAQSGAIAMHMPQLRLLDPDH